MIERKLTGNVDVRRCWRDATDAEWKTARAAVDAVKA